MPKRETKPALIRLLLEREESDRKHLARAIHDGLGHQLLALRNSAALALRLPGSGPELRGQLLALSELASSAHRLARDLARCLRPFELDELGLGPAIEALLAERFEGSNLRIFKDLAALPPGLDAWRRIHLYRVVEEALGNIAHHAHATNILIETTATPERLVLTLEDDGMGFDIAAARRAGAGLGLARMAQHAKALRARLHLRSSPGLGARLRLSLPLGPPRPPSAKPAKSG